MTQEPPFKSPTFTLTAPPNAAFSFNNWLNTQEETPITLLEKHGNEEAIIASIGDKTVFLKPTPNSDTTDKIDVAILEGTVADENELETRLKGEFAEHVFVTDQDYINDHLIGAASTMVSIGEWFESAVTHFKATESVLSMNATRTFKAGKEPASMTGAYPYAQDQFKQACNDVNRGMQTLESLESELHEKQIRGAVYPEILESLGEPLSSFKCNATYELDYIVPDNPTKRNIVDTQDDLEEFRQAVEKEHSLLRDLVKQYAPGLLRRMENYE